MNAFLELFFFIFAYWKDQTFGTIELAERILKEKNGDFRTK